MKDKIIQLLKAYSTDNKEAKLTSIDYNRIDNLANDLSKLLHMGNFIVRDWMSAEIYEFDNYYEAKDNFNKLLDKENECDIQFYQILDEYNNIVSGINKNKK